MFEPGCEPQTLAPSFLLPSNFEFGAVPSQEGTGEPAPAPPQTPSLGPLAAFTGTFTGNGFNTIFRPDLGSPTTLPTSVGSSDNLLELNLTSETLSFSPSLGSVPNRGEVNPDVFLNGVPYVQTVTDITDPSAPIGIHFEPGLWMIVPSTKDPDEGTSLVRMASIPHGTTINCQGTFRTFAGPPSPPPVTITPSSGPFPSQTATDAKTARIPQDLSTFIAAGTITQAMLTDPNTVLRDVFTKQTITTTTALSVAANPVSPLFGGGAENIAFLKGDKTASAPNAQVTQFSATFWIETVQSTITVPDWSPGDPALTIPADAITGAPTPVFSVTPSAAVTTPFQATVTSTQIQYSQKTLLNFNGIIWPHVSVATLIPSAPVPVTVTVP